MKTHMVTIVTEDGWDTEKMYERLDDLTADMCSCNDHPERECTFHLMSRSTVHHKEDEWVDVVEELKRGEE